MAEDKKGKNTKGKKSNTKKTKNKRTANIIILSFLLAGIIATIVTVYSNYNNGSPIAIKKLPLIQSPVYSSNGEVHDFKTNVAFGIDKTLTTKYDQDEMLSITQATIDRLDYDLLNAPDGTDYLKNEIKASVVAQNPDLVNENFDVYISGYDLGLINGFLPGLIEDAPVPKGANNRDDKIIEMFGNK